MRWPLFVAFALLLVALTVGGVGASWALAGRASAWRQIDPQTLPQCAVPAAPAWRRMESGT